MVFWRDIFLAAQKCWMRWEKEAFAAAAVFEMWPLVHNTNALFTHISTLSFFVFLSTQYTLLPSNLDCVCTVYIYNTHIHF